MRSSRERAEQGRGVKAPWELRLDEVRANGRQLRKRQAPSVVYQASLKREERARLRQQQEALARRAMRRQVQAATLEQSQPKLPAGRPRSTLDPAMARAVLDAIAAGTSFRRLEELLRAETDPQGRPPYPHTRQWLAARYKDGKLAEWAVQEKATVSGP